MLYNITSARSPRSSCGIIVCSKLLQFAIKYCKTVICIYHVYSYNIQVPTYIRIAGTKNRGDTASCTPVQWSHEVIVRGTHWSPPAPLEFGRERESSTYFLFSPFSVFHSTRYGFPNSLTAN